MRDEELHWIYKMIGAYGFSTVKELLDKYEETQTEKQELIEFLKEEQDRLARECSHIYEDSLGKTRLVSEDIYNEVSKILSKIEKR